MQPSNRTHQALSLWHSITVRALHDLPYDLSSRQAGILLTVYMTPPPHTVKNLSEKLGISKPSVCRAIDTLSKTGLVKRRKDEDDRRNVLIQRTMKGSVYLSEFGDIIAQSLEGPARIAA